MPPRYGRASLQCHIEATWLMLASQPPVREKSPRAPQFSRRRRSLRRAVPHRCGAKVKRPAARCRPDDPRRGQTADRPHLDGTRGRGAVCKCRYVSTTTTPLPTPRPHSPVPPGVARRGVSPHSSKIPIEFPIPMTSTTLDPCVTDEMQGLRASCTCAGQDPTIAAGGIHLVAFCIAARVHTDELHAAQ